MVKNALNLMCRIRYFDRTGGEALARDEKWKVARRTSFDGEIFACIITLISSLTFGSLSQRKTPHYQNQLYQSY